MCKKCQMVMMIIFMSVRVVKSYMAMWCCSEITTSSTPRCGGDLLNYFKLTSVFFLSQYINWKHVYLYTIHNRYKAAVD